MQMELSSQSQSIEQYQVDAFSDPPFGGNPAAVVFEHRDAAWMQSLAAENNLSETAFVQLRPGTSDVFDIRWCVYSHLVIRMHSISQHLFVDINCVSQVYSNERG